MRFASTRPFHFAPALAVLLLFGASESGASATAAAPSGSPEAKAVAPAPKTTPTVVKPAAKPAARSAKSAAAPIAEALSVQDFQQMARTANDSASAPANIKRLRAWLAGKPDAEFIWFGRILLVQSLISSKAPIASVVKEAELTIPTLPDRPEQRSSFYLTVANAVVERGGSSETAVRYANHALSDAPDTPNFSALRSMSHDVLGRALLARGEATEAVGHLETAMIDTPDSQSVLAHLGAAYEKAGRDEDAERAYVRSLGVFAGDDTVAAAPMRELWAKRHGSSAGMDAAVAASRAASREHEAFATRRYEQPAPEWTLPDLQQKPVASSTLLGKVVVMDFWGSWCGPCRMELPAYEALYQRYRGNPNVAFMSVNWEHAQTADEHAETAREFMARSKYTFPVVYDHAGDALKSYKVESFPSVYVIDKSGTIRFRNVGFGPGIEDIITAQLESLIE